MTITIIAVITFFTIANILLLAPALHFVVGRKFQKQFPHAHTLFPNIPGFNKYACAVTYATCIIYRQRSKSNKAIYGVVKGYDFRKNSTTFQKLFSIYYLANGFAMIIGLTVMFIYSFYLD